MGRQGTLDGFIRKPAGPIVYMCENVLHVVTQFVAVNNQVSTLQQNFLVSSSPALVPFHCKQNDVLKMLGHNAAKVDLRRSANNT